MKTHRIITSATVAIILASAVATPHFPGFSPSAWAKEGNGNGGGGNGGGHDGAGGGNGNGNGHSGSGGSGRSEAEQRGRGHEKTERQEHLAETEKHRKAASASVSASDLKGLNSLNRNYRAYLNSQDPRMAAIASYAKAYAQYEIDMGAEPASTDPTLGDDALRDALSAFTGDPVSDRALERAKSILGVGPAQGKIDQIRTAMDG
jgi:hypothetical protein